MDLHWKEIKKKMTKRKIILIVCIINILIFIFANTLFQVKYEQVDDFIIYNMYSGLDGTFNIHGIYIHPLLSCPENNDKHIPRFHEDNMG